MRSLLFFILAVLSFNAFAKVHGIKDQITIINNTKFSKEGPIAAYGGNVMKNHTVVLIPAGQRIIYDTADLSADNILPLPVLNAFGNVYDQLIIRVSAINPETGETFISWPEKGTRACFYQEHLCVRNSEDGKTVTITQK